MFYLGKNMHSVCVWSGVGGVKINVSFETCRVADAQKGVCKVAANHMAAGVCVCVQRG